MNALNKTRLSGIASLVSFGALVGGCSIRDHFGHYSVTLQITDATTGTPLAGVAVEFGTTRQVPDDRWPPGDDALSSAQYDDRIMATTDEEGKFVVSIGTTFGFGIFESKICARSGFVDPFWILRVGESDSPVVLILQADDETATADDFAGQVAEVDSIRAEVISTGCAIG